MPTDGSAISARAFEYAHDLAIKGNAQLVVVRAINQPPPYLAYLGEEWLNREYESRSVLAQAKIPVLIINVQKG